MLCIAMVDDHRLVREGVRHILDAQTDMKVGFEFESGKEVVSHLQQDNNIDLLLLDMSMPGCNGVELLQEIKKLKPDLPVLVLSMHPEEVYGTRAIRAGATGYITKDSDLEELLRAVRTVARHQLYMSTALASMVIKQVQKGSEILPSLSIRELQVLKMLAMGQSVSAIASDLFVSIKTISTHKTNIQNKLGVSSTAHLVHYAIKHQLIDVYELFS